MALGHSAAPSQCWGQEGAHSLAPLPPLPGGGGWEAPVDSGLSRVPRARHNLFHHGLGVINGPIVRGSGGRGGFFICI